MASKLSYTASALGAFALLAVSASSASAVPAEPRSTAVAASCYGGATSYAKPGNQPLLSWFVTSGNCNDINVKPQTDRYMKICFGSSASDCQANWKLAKAHKWNVIATNVLPGTRYLIWFKSNAASSGQIAD